MIIGGFQRFSLLDYPGKLSAIVFTQGCNFRCPYCHNPELVDPIRYGNQLQEAEILAFLKQRRGKLGAVTITGGEPTLQPNLIAFLTKLRSLDYAVKLDTNGSFPEVLTQVIDQKLVNYIAMDIKAPLELYQIVTQSHIHSDTIMESMNVIRKAGLKYEFRTTLFDRIMTWDDIDRIKALLKQGDHFYVQQCRYQNTLEDLQAGDLERTSALHKQSLSEDPAALEFVRWGKNNSISVSVRSL